MYKILISIVLFICVFADVKTYKVTMSKDSASKNRIVYVQATDSSQAREMAKDQNPGWKVEVVSEVKATTQSSR